MYPQIPINRPKTIPRKIARLLVGTDVTGCGSDTVTIGISGSVASSVDDCGLESPYAIGTVLLSKER